MKKPTKFDYTVLACTIVVASLVFIATLLTYAPQPQAPLSPERVNELILRAAAGFATLAGLTVFVTLSIWHDLHNPA